MTKLRAFLAEHRLRLAGSANLLWALFNAAFMYLSWPSPWALLNAAALGACLPMAAICFKPALVPVRVLPPTEENMAEMKRQIAEVVAEIEREFGGRVRFGRPDDLLPPSVH